MFWIHAIWKYVNCTVVSLLSKCICNHSSDLTESVRCIFTDLNSQMWPFKVVGSGSSPCESEHPCYSSVLKQETETHSAVLSPTILSDLFGKRIKQKETFSFRNKHISITLSLWTYYSTEEHVGISRRLTLARLQTPTTACVILPFIYFFVNSLQALTHYLY